MCIGEKGSVCVGMWKRERERGGVEGERENKREKERVFTSATYIVVE